VRLWSTVKPIDLGISSGDIPTLAYTRTVPVADIEAGRAIKKSLIEGYRSLGTASIFAAGVESQCIGLVTDAASKASPRLMGIANAFLLTGLILSSFGTALAFLTANWYEYLEGVQLEALAYRWTHAKRILIQDNRKEVPLVEPPELTSQRCSWKDYMVSVAMSSVLSIIMLGSYSFITGMILYIWGAHPLPTAIINTTVAVIGTVLISCMYLNSERLGVLKVMSFKINNI
ncbi:hypothetical protein RSAG8_08910, partial [Rhizoctonia solani AG-8 WAC10335]